MPDFGEKTRLKIKSPEIAVLDNGIKVFLIPDNTIDFTRFEFVFNSGTALQPKKVVSECTLNLLNEGSVNLSGEEIATKLDYYGAYFEPLLTKDKGSLAVYTLSKYQSKVLDLIYDITINPLYDEDNMHNYLNRKKHKYLSDLDKVKFRAMVEFNRLIFGETTPYGSTKDANDFDNVQKNDLVQYHREHYFTDNNYIIVAGRIKAQTVSELNKLFGNISLYKYHLNGSFDYKNRFTPGNNLVNIKSSMQSAIRIGRLIMPKTHEDYTRFVVLNTILGGYFGSRLMSNLREKNGYTYGINSFILNFRDADYWSVSTQVNIDQTDAALLEIRNEIDKLKKIQVSEEELNLVKNYLYGTYLRSFDGPMSMADRVRASVDLQLEVSHYQNNLNNILKVSSGDIQEVANKYLNDDSFIYLVVGNSNF